MSWLQDWNALAARVRGLIDAGTFFFTSQHHSSEDSASVKRKILLKHAENIFVDIKRFLSNYKSVLPNSALQSLERFLTDPNIAAINFDEKQQGRIDANVQLALTSLSAFCAEFTYMVTDTQAIARRITERAFIHLQRSLVVDGELRDKWMMALKERTEIACEKLGALHLLSHGIWAFKADATKGRTDLILNEPLPSLSIIESSSDALVLTEWKLIRKREELVDRITEARKQTEAYSRGVLGGIELANYRYLVFVSEKTIEMPNDIVDGIVTYRHINIAVNPDAPSLEAKDRG